MATIRDNDIPTLLNGDKCKKIFNDNQAKLLDEFLKQEKRNNQSYLPFVYHNFRKYINLDKFTAWQFEVWVRLLNSPKPYTGDINNNHDYHIKKCIDEIIQCTSTPITKK